MKTILLTLSLMLQAVNAQEYPTPPAQVAAAELPTFDLISSITQYVMKEEPAPLSGMLPVRKLISETVQVVDDPQLVVQKPAIEPRVTRELTDEQRARWYANRRKMITLNFSATVYDHKRSFLRWYPHGHRAPAMTAWSAIDFNVFCGINRFICQDQEYILLFMGVENVNTEKRKLTAQRWGKVYQPPAFPDLPETGTAEFVMVQGDAMDTKALEPITTMHELYREESVRLHADYAARLQAQAERETWLRANPPQPQDVLIRVWKTEAPVDANSLAHPIAPLVETSVEP